MKIAIVGTGSVGAALGRRLTQLGHKIIFGSRHPDSEKPQKLAQSIGAHATTAAVATSRAEIAILAVPWTAVQETLTAMGALEGKVLLDCTNPLKPDLSGLLPLDAGSGGEQVARWAEGARVVKVFNTTGAGNLENPDYPHHTPDMLLAGDDEAAKVAASRLAEAIGFTAVDAGPLRNSALLESLALLWITLAVHRGLGPDFAFAIDRR